MRRLLGLLALLALLLAACAGGTGGAGGGGGGATDVAATPGGGATAGPTVQAGPGDVPDSLAFSAPTVSGATFEGGDVAGEDLLLWFWAPW